MSAEGSWPVWADSRARLEVQYLCEGRSGVGYRGGQGQQMTRAGLVVGRPTAGYVLVFYTALEVRETFAGDH